MMGLRTRFPRSLWLGATFAALASGNCIINPQKDFPVGRANVQTPGGSAGEAGEPMVVQPKAGASADAGGTAGSAPVTTSAGHGGEPANEGGVQFGPCDRGAWIASASVGVLPERAIDGDPTTRWTTDVARETGQWFEIDFGQPLALRSLELHTELYPLDSPTLARINLDGVPASYTPETPAPGIFTLQLDGRRVQTARIIASDQGAPVPDFGDQPAWWSIYEIAATCEPGD